MFSEQRTSIPFPMHVWLPCCRPPTARPGAGQKPNFQGIAQAIESSMILFGSVLWRRSDSLRDHGHVRSTSRLLLQRTVSWLREEIARTRPLIATKLPLSHRKPWPAKLQRASGSDQTPAKTGVLQHAEDNQRSRCHQGNKALAARPRLTLSLLHQLAGQHFSPWFCA